MSRTAAQEGRLCVVKSWRYTGGIVDLSKPQKFDTCRGQTLFYVPAISRACSDVWPRCASEASGRRTPSSPDRSRLVPLALDYTRLSRRKPNREPVRRLMAVALFTVASLRTYQIWTGLITLVGGKGCSAKRTQRTAGSELSLRCSFVRTFISVIIRTLYCYMARDYQGESTSVDSKSSIQKSIYCLWTTLTTIHADKSSYLFIIKGKGFTGKI